MDAQTPGRLSHIASGQLHRLKDNLLLRLLDGLVVVRESRSLRRGRFQNVFRQVFGPDDIAGAKHHGALDSVLELPHVTWPAVLGQADARFGGNAHVVALAHAAVFLGEVGGEEGNIVAAFAQGWHSEGDDVEPEEEVPPEAALTDGFIQVLICGGDQPNIHLDGMGAADALIPRYLHIGPDWMTKEGTREPRRELLDEEMRFLTGNPHEAWARRVFELAGVDYGRLDYGVRQGRPQAWEINLTPFLGPRRSRNPKPELDALMLAARERTHAAIREALVRIDPGEIPGREVEFDFPSGLEEQARQERERADSLKRRQRWIGRIAAAPVARKIAAKLRAKLL